MSASVTLFQEFFGRAGYQGLGCRDIWDNLSINIIRDRGFQELFSDFSSLSGIILAGVRTGKPG
jgi:hypothetical protein